jgi:hypothetical protein
MKRHTVTIAKREFNLAFTLNTMIRMQEDQPDFDFNKLDVILRQPKGLVDVLYQLALSGAALEDSPLDVSKEWMAEHIPANQKSLAEIQMGVVNALTDGMRMETEEEENENREVDVVLEEIKKKDEKTDSPGEK